ncbi:hypothetical protein BLAT2472_20657 [Burkholderia latens]
MSRAPRPARSRRIHGGLFDETDPHDARGSVRVRGRVRAGRMHATERRLRHARRAAGAAGRPRRVAGLDDAGREHALRHASVAAQHDAGRRGRRRGARRAAAGAERRAGRSAAAGYAAADAVLTSGGGRGAPSRPGLRRESRAP